MFIIRILIERRENMKKVVILEVFVDELLEDAEKCIQDFINHALAHEYVDDSSLDVDVIRIND
jgi:hypothetical protein